MVIQQDIKAYTNQNFPKVSSSIILGCSPPNKAFVIAIDNVCDSHASLHLTLRLFSKFLSLIKTKLIFNFVEQTPACRNKLLEKGMK